MKLAAILAMGALAGCSAFGTTHIQSVGEDGKQILFVDANRRAIIVHETGGVRRFCTEPAPDVAANLKDTLAASLSASVKAAAAKADASGQGTLSKDEALTIVQLINRSQGLQNFRDALFRACEARLNGFISNREYILVLNNAISSTTALIAVELMTNKGFEKDTQLSESKLKQVLNFMQIMFANPL